jgi:ribonuclease HII
MYIKTDLSTIGVDEVGRGTLFGNVVAAAVIMPDNLDDDELYKQIKDSKKLSFKKRTILANYIKEKAITYGIGIATPKEIDEINILHASIKAMHRALFQAYKIHKFSNIIVDGNYFKPIICSEDEIINYECIPQGDTKYINIAAASIIAKDFHDNEIIQLIKENPDLNKYDLLKNMGYATLKHRLAIKQFGINNTYHRKTFSSCAVVIKEDDN